MRVHVVDLAIGGAPAVEGVAVPGRHADRGVGVVFDGMIGVAGDRVGVADEILPAAARNRLAVVDHPGAGGAIFGLGKIFLAVNGGLRAVARSRPKLLLPLRGRRPHVRNSNPMETPSPDFDAHQRIPAIDMRTSWSSRMKTKRVRLDFRSTHPAYCLRILSKILIHSIP